MTTRYVCDWCYDEFDDREHVASVDVTIGAINETVHMCAACAPDHLKQHYPDREVATDGGHDLRALRRGIEATLQDPDTERRDGPYRFRARAITGTRYAAAETRREVVVGYGSLDEWLVVPEAFADVVLDALRERVDERDYELVTDGGFGLDADRYAGECECGRTVATVASRTTGSIASDSTVRVRCEGCGSIVRARIVEPDERELATDGGTQGAVDHDYDDATQDPWDQVHDALAEVGADAPLHSDLGPGDIAIDLVTRQPLYITGIAAADLVEHYRETDFNLATYKQHPWLPVRIEDRVFECVFIGSIDDLHSFSNTYDYPAGRLARVPIELAGGDDA